MLTVGEAKLVHENINPLISALFIGAFALGAGLIIWHTAFGENPVANAFEQAILASQHIPQ